MANAIYLLTHRNAIIGPAHLLATPVTVAVPYFTDRDEAEAARKSLEARLRDTVTVLALALAAEPAPVPVADAAGSVAVAAEAAV